MRVKTRAPIATENRFRASAFVVDRAKICLTSSLITLQNLVAVSRVCAQV